MKEYQQQELEDLIRCEKRIVQVARKELRLERGSYRNNMDLESMDQKFQFHAFIRRNEHFPENFSIGLRYLAPADARDLVLLRCNGPHAQISLQGEGDWHIAYHIHKPDAAALNAGERLEKKAEITTAYASYPEALAHFLALVNVVNSTEHFPDAGRQMHMRLFETEGGQA